MTWEQMRDGLSWPSAVLLSVPPPNAQPDFVNIIRQTVEAERAK